MARKIYIRTPTPASKQRQKKEALGATKGDERILIHMESEDPRLLDMEACKLYEILINSGARILGPIPVPIKEIDNINRQNMESRIHRRLIMILKSSEETISVLEKLPVSHHISISFEVEDAQPSRDTVATFPPLDSRSRRE